MNKINRRAFLGFPLGQIATIANLLFYPSLEKPKRTQLPELPDRFLAGGIPTEGMELPAHPMHLFIWTTEHWCFSEFHELLKQISQTEEGHCVNPCFIANQWETKGKFSGTTSGMGQGCFRDWSPRVGPDSASSLCQNWTGLEDTPLASFAELITCLLERRSPCTLGISEIFCDDCTMRTEGKHLAFPT